MNKIFSIVWNRARQTLMVAGENAKCAVKTSSTLRPGSRRAGAWMRRVERVLACLAVLFPGLVSAQTVIVTDGRTQTTVQKPNTQISNVSTSTLSGANAFNSFSQFKVGQGHTVNLIVPTQATNLINLISGGQRAEIHGLLNSIKNGQIGGNVWFASPSGFLVGKTGVVNVGSLTVVTPTQKFVDDFFIGGAPNEDSVTLLLGRRAPRNKDGQITIDGVVNAIDGATLSAGAINVAGSIYSGAQYRGSAPEFTDVVNITGVVAGNNLVVRNGRIEIIAESDSSGEMSIALNGATLKAGEITLTARSRADEKLMPVLVPTAKALVNVNDSTLEASTAGIAMTAEATVDAAPASISPLVNVVATAEAAVSVSGSSKLSARKDVQLASRSDVSSKAISSAPDVAKLPGDAGVAINVINSTANTLIGGETAVDVDGTLSLTAINRVKADARADASASGSAAGGGTLALNEINTTTRAGITDNAEVKNSAAINLSAESEHRVTTNAKAAANGAQKQEAGKSSQTEDALGKYKDQASTSEGGVNVAAAVAIANVNSTTEASISSKKKIASSGKVEVVSKALTKMTTVADGSSAGGGTGIGAAVAINVGVSSNRAKIVDGALVTAQGVAVQALMPEGETNTYLADAKSGAGASNIGVAGALAANVVVNSTQAALEGDLDKSGKGAEVDVGGGDLQVAASQAGKSEVVAAADVQVTPPSSGTGTSGSSGGSSGTGTTGGAGGTGGTGASGGKLGIGPSVAVNVAVNQVDAVIGDDAWVTGGKDATVKASGEYEQSTTAKGGAAGASASITPVAAVTVGVNTTTARLGKGQQLSLLGDLTVQATQKSLSSTSAEGATQGDKIAVGASLALNTSTDTVVFRCEESQA